MPVFQTAGNSGGKGIQGKMTSFWYKVWDNCKRVEWKCFSNSFIKSFTHSLKKLSCFVPRIMLSAAYLIPGESGRDRHVHCDCRESEKALGESRRGKFLKVLGLWDYRSDKIWKIRRCWSYLQEMVSESQDGLNPILMEAKRQKVKVESCWDTERIGKSQVSATGRKYWKVLEKFTDTEERVSGSLPIVWVLEQLWGTGFSGAKIAEVRGSREKVKAWSARVKNMVIKETWKMESNQTGHQQSKTKSSPFI